MSRMIRVICLLLALPLGAQAAQAAPGGAATARVFSMTNAPAGNEILMLSYTPGSGLVMSGSVASGGSGTGAGLGNQGGVVLSDDNRWLFAVNAGSDSISVFRVLDTGLALVDTVASGGSQPVSVTTFGDLLYVLNAGSDSIAGFHIGVAGQLTALPNSVRYLSGAGTGPAQISFSPWGDALVVTEKATNLITTFVVAGGLPGNAIINASVGATPFGFGFDRFGHLLVTEAAGGAPDASSVSSYELRADGSLAVLDAAVATTESAACWLLTSKNGRVAFTTNTASQSISALRVGRSGELTLTTADGVAASTGAGSSPIDLAITGSGRLMFALSAVDGSISAYGVLANGTLSPLTGATGLPTGMNGLAAF